MGRATHDDALAGPFCPLISSSSASSQPAGLGRGTKKKRDRTRAGCECGLGSPGPFISCCSSMPHADHCNMCMADRGVAHSGWPHPTPRTSACSSRLCTPVHSVHQRAPVAVQLGSAPLTCAPLWFSLLAIVESVCMRWDERGPPDPPVLVLSRTSRTAHLPRACVCTGTTGSQRWGCRQAASWICSAHTPSVAPAF